MKAELKLMQDTDWCGKRIISNNSNNNNIAPVAPVTFTAPSLHWQSTVREC